MVFGGEVSTPLPARSPAPHCAGSCSRQFQLQLAEQGPVLSGLAALYLHVRDSVCQQRRQKSRAGHPMSC